MMESASYNTHSQLLYPSSRPGTPAYVVWGYAESQVSQDAKARAEREVTQKCKAKAEARPNSKAPGPIDTPSKRWRAEPSQGSNESILDFTTDDDRAKCHLDLVDLKEIYDNPYPSDPEAQPPEIPEDETMTVLPPEGVDEEPPSGPTDDEVPPHSCAPTPLARLGSSDYTTTMSDVQLNPRRGRDESGNRFPLSSSGNVGKPPGKEKPKAVKPADNRPTSGPQHRPRDAAPPNRLQNSLAVTSHEPQAPATTPANQTRSSLPSSARTTGTYTPNLPSRGVGNTSPATPAQPSRPAKPSTSAKPSRNAAASVSKSSRAGPTRKVVRPSDPCSKCPNQSLTTQKSKPSNVGSTRSAKHQKSRHKGGRRGKALGTTRLRRQPTEDEGDGDDEGEDENEDEAEGEDVKGRTLSHACKEKLVEYFDKSTYDSEYYYFAMVLDPRYKDSLFKANSDMIEDLLSAEWMSDCANALIQTCQEFYSLPFDGPLNESQPQKSEIVGFNTFSHAFRASVPQRSGQSFNTRTVPPLGPEPPGFGHGTGQFRG
ncbi:hypothetical protein RSOL_427450, partial [Rhizoctonia solani AG-3 Rhs1AP]